MESFGEIVDAALNRVEPLLVKAWEEYQSTGAGKLFAVQFLKIISGEPALCWVQVCDCDQVGVCNFNRSFQGFSAMQAVQNGVAHCNAGYSLDLANADNWALQPDPKLFLQMIEENRALSAKQGLRPCGNLLVLSWAGTHNNVFLRAIRSGLACDSPKWAPTGFLQEDHISQKAADVGRALQGGLEYKVLHYSCYIKFGEKLRATCRLLNVKGQSEMTEMEGLSTLKGILNSGSSLAEAVSALAVQAPFFQGWLPAMANLAQELPQELLTDMSILKAHIKVPTGSGAPGRFGFAGGDYLKNLAQVKAAIKLDMTAGHRLLSALYMAQLNCPLVFINEGKCEFMNNGDLIKLKKVGLGVLVEADKMLNQARDFIQQSSISESDKMLALLSFDCEVIYHLVGKKNTKSKLVFTDLSALWGAFKVDMFLPKPALPAAVPMSKSAPPPDANASSAPSLSDLKSLAFHTARTIPIGSCVKFKNISNNGKQVVISGTVCYKACYMLEDMSDEVASLKVIGMNAVSVDGVVADLIKVATAELNSICMVAQLPKNAAVVPWDAPKDTENVSLIAATSNISFIVHKAVEAYKGHLITAMNNLEYWEFPMRACRSKACMDKGDLMIFPSVARVTLVEHVEPEYGAHKTIAQLCAEVNGPCKMLGSLATVENKKYLIQLGLWTGRTLYTSIHPAPEGHKVNMVSKFHVAADGLKIPYLTNSVSIKKGDLLWMSPYPSHEAKAKSVIAAAKAKAKEAATAAKAAAASSKAPAAAHRKGLKRKNNE